MTFRFKKYSVKALKECGEAFCDEAGKFEKAQRKRITTGQWTEFVLDWFARAAPDEMLVDSTSKQCDRAPPPFELPERQGFGEFLVDLTHSTYPKYSEEKPYPGGAYFDAALERACIVRLALESEWGDPDSGPTTRKAVLEDAVKVAAMRADTKVVVFGSHAGTRSKILSDLSTLRKRSEDPSPWLVIDVPWKSKTGETGASWRVIA